MIFQIQHFEVANLIFTSNQDSFFELNKLEKTEIQNRFQSVMDSFLTAEKYYNSSFIKYNDNLLPYNASVSLFCKQDQLVLHFSISYNNPLLFIFDIQKGTVRNFVDISQVKDVLNNDVYEDLKDSLMVPKYLNNRFKGVPDFNRFAEVYKELLKQHENKNTITGRDCFEIAIDELDIV